MNPPDDTISKLPRKKRSILWWILALFLLLIGLFVFQLIGPDPQLIVSPQTTYITKPLGPKGIPNFEQYVLDRYRDGVTPQNNAAALLWTALWPGELTPGDYASVANELGLAQIPSKDDALVPLHRYAETKPFMDWLAKQLNLHPSAAGNSNTTESPEWMDLQAEVGADVFRNFELEREMLLEQASSRPWTSEQIPPLAQWIQQNEKPFALILEASTRPRCYFPSPTLINNETDSLIMYLLPGVQGCREVGRSLPARAMWHLGEGRPMEAWQDLLALHRIARLVAQGPTLVEQLVGFAIQGSACDRTQTLLHHGQLSAEQIQQIRRDLAALPLFAGVTTTLDQLERVASIDAVVGLVNNNWNAQAVEEILGADDEGLRALQIVSVDWNLVLRDINQWYDRLAAAARMPDRAMRAAALNKVENDMQALVGNARRPTKLALSLISRHERSEVVAAIVIGLLLPALNAATAAEDRANATIQLTQLAAALAAYRATNGKYPEKLDDLMPTILDKLPVDLYNSAPFIYRRDNDGYLLYSTGENGADDGGSSIYLSRLQGVQIDDSNSELHSKIPSGSDDISILQPRPPIKLRKPTSDAP
jgi:hypothetical protein